MGLLTAREAAQHLHVSLFTLGRMEKEGLLAPFRTPGGHRRYSQEMLDHYLEGSRSQRANQERRILVVDQRDQLTHALARAFPTCRFTRAQDELQVGIKLAEFKPHLVLVNTTMRDMDGQGLCRRLNGQNPHLKALPFHTPEEGERAARDSMIDALDLDALRASIAAALGLEHGRETG